MPIYFPVCTSVRFSQDEYTMCTLRCYLLSEFQREGKGEGHAISQRDEVTWDLEDRRCWNI